MTTVESSSQTAEAPSKSQEKSGVSALSLAMVLLIGVYFGIVLTKSEVVRWQRVHDMFLFNELHMYLIISVGIAVGLVSILVMRKLGIRNLDGETYHYKPKPFHQGIIWGGILFGAGWAITGACPGPIYAQLGAGAWVAWFTFVGAMVGMYLFAWLKPRLPM